MQKDKDSQFYLNLLKQGTVSDKISALAIIIQKNPGSSIPYLQSLMNLAKKKNRKQAELAITALKDLFCDYLLDDSKKLWPFSKNPSICKQTNPNPKDYELIQSLWEHLLKESYQNFITNILKPLTVDDLDFFRKYSLNTLQALLEK